MSRPNDLRSKSGAGGTVGAGKHLGPAGSNPTNPFAKHAAGNIPPKSTTPKSQRGGGGNAPAVPGAASKVTGIRPKV